MSQGSKVFSLLVIGDNPDDKIMKYDENLKVDKYIKYTYKSAKKYREKAIKLAEEIIKNADKFQLTSYHIDYFNEKIQHLKNITDFEHYQQLTENLYIDDEGNAWSTENENGKFQTCVKGKNFSLPFIKLDGSETNSALKGEIDWNKMHMNRDIVNVYDITWDLVKGGRTPSTPDEEKIYSNMSNMTTYFENFKNKTEYVVHNCAYHNYAVITEDGVWHEISDANNSMEWIATFYNIFIEKLSDDVQLTVYECTKGKEN